MNIIEQIAQKIHKRHAKSNKRRAELREALASVDRAERERDSVDLSTFSEQAQREIVSRVRSLDTEEPTVEKVTE